MADALDIPRLSSQPRQGVGARLFRRLGGAVRNAIAGGLSLAGAPRRPDAPQTVIGHAVVRNADARPAPARVRALRRTRTAPPAPPSRPAWRGWFARLVGDRCRPPLPVSRAQFLTDSDAPFTPEEFPGLSPEACAFFSTPLEDLDPEILARLLGALAEKIADLIPSEAGQTESGSLLSTLLGGFGVTLGEAQPDLPPIGALDTVPGVATDAAPPQAPVSAPDPLAEASAVTPVEALPDAPSASPDPPAPPLPAAPLGSLPPPFEARAPELRHKVPTAASATAPGTASWPGPFSHAWHLILACNNPSRKRNKRDVHHGRSPFCGSRFSCGHLKILPLRHWCFAARASPA